MSPRWPLTVSAAAALCLCLAAPSHAADTTEPLRIVNGAFGAVEPSAGSAFGTLLVENTTKRPLTRLKASLTFWDEDGRIIPDGSAGGRQDWISRGAYLREALPNERVGMAIQAPATAARWQVNWVTGVPTRARTARKFRILDTETLTTATGNRVAHVKVRNNNGRTVGNPTMQLLCNGRQGLTAVDGIRMIPPGDPKRVKPKATVIVTAMWDPDYFVDCTKIVGITINAK